MTILLSTLLDDVIKKQKIINPRDILTELDFRVQKIFGTEYKIGKSVDGATVSVLAINSDDKTINFSGAGSSLYMIKDGNLSFFRGVNYSIGSVALKKKKEFLVETIHPISGDAFYIYSDGFQDQFGGENNRKYTRKRFGNLLLDLSKLSMDLQKKYLKQKFMEWKGDQKQIDDVMVIGFKVI